MEIGMRVNIGKIGNQGRVNIHGSIDVVLMGSF
jgi:hypothetical protein